MSLRAMLSLLLIVLISTSSAKAADKVWDNEEGNNLWNEDNNWDPNGRPQSFEDVEVNGTPTISGDPGLSNDLENTGTINVEGALQHGGTVLNNTGTINVGDGSAIVSTVTVGDGAIISGSGEIVLMNSDNLPASNASILGGTTTAVTNSLGHTIRGEGSLAQLWINEGIIRAEETTGDSSAVLRLNNITFVNNNELRSSSSASIEMISINYSQNASGQLVADTTDISISGSNSFTGGTYASSGGAKFVQASGITTISGITLNSAYDMNQGAMLVGAGGLTNNNTVTLGTPISTQIQFRFDVAGSLDGTGELILNRSNAEIGTLTAGQTITHGANHTIRGVGTIRSQIINNGTILAEPKNGGTLLNFFQNSFTVPQTNNGLIEATSGTTVRFNQTTPLTQGASGRLSAANGGTVELNVASITGGRLESTGTGRFVLTNSSEIVSVTNAAVIDVPTFDTLTVGGGSLTNDGTINLNSDGGAFFSPLRFSENTLIDGTGEVFLNGFNNTSRSEVIPDGNVVTQSPGHTIRGKGQLIGPGTFVNNGRIEGDSSADPILIRTRLEGTGVLENVVVDRGTFSDQIGFHAPGNGVGTVPLEGSYSITNNQAHLEIEIGGTNPGTEHDQLSSTGTVSLNGVLDVFAVDLGNSYVPSPGDRFDIIESTSAISGTFFTENFPAQLGGKAVTWLPVDYLTDPNKVSLEIDGVFSIADLDQDGFVDGVDLGILLGNWNQSVGLSGGELNDMPPVDGLDLGILLSEWNPPPLAATAVPEPTVLYLLLIGLIVIPGFHRCEATRKNSPQV